MSTLTAVKTTPNPETGKINFDVVCEILRDALSAAEETNGKGPTGTGAQRNASEAQFSRALLNLSDQLMLASTLVRNEYWSAKGQTSYDL